MERIKLIYNPYAGGRKFVYLLDYTLEVFQNKGYAVHVFRSTSKDNLQYLIAKKSCHNYAALFIAGGDGSVNLAVNTLLGNELDIPLGIIPAGTANDFAGHLGIPRDLKEAINSLSNMEIRKIDVGLVNGQYFINVCSGGLLTDISQRIDLGQKNAMGKIAYYVKGMQELPNLRNIRLRIQAEGVDITDDICLFLVLNGSSAGGFSKLGQLASVYDGKLDFVGFKAMNISEFPLIFSKMLLGEHLHDKRVIYFQTKALKIDMLDIDPSSQKTDIDGEKGPDYPLNICIVPSCLKIVYPSIKQ